MIYSDNWQKMEAQTKSVEAMIANGVRKFRLVVTKAIGRPVVWVKCGSEESMYYVVGIQGDGSIVRAEGLSSTGWPMDPRCANGQVVVKKQIGMENCKFVRYTDGAWPKEEDVEWVEAGIASVVRKFGLVVTRVDQKPIVWVVMMRRVPASVHFVVGIQSNGSILRAEKLFDSGLPLDPRCANGVVVLKKQLGG